MITHKEIAGAVLESLSNCLGAELVEGLGLDSPFVDDLGLDSVELMNVLAVIESRIGIDSERGAISRELATHPSTTIRAFIDMVEEAILRRTRDGRDVKQ
jgi:acyl carrier protein